MHTLKIENLTVEVEDKVILNKCKKYFNQGGNNEK